MARYSTLPELTSYVLSGLLRSRGKMIHVLTSVGRAMVDKILEQGVDVPDGFDEYKELFNQIDIHYKKPKNFEWQWTQIHYRTLAHKDYVGRMLTPITCLHTFINALIGIVRFGRISAGIRDDIARMLKYLVYCAAILASGNAESPDGYAIVRNMIVDFKSISR